MLARGRNTSAGEKVPNESWVIYAWSILPLQLGYSTRHRQTQVFFCGCCFLHPKNCFLYLLTECKGATNTECNFTFRISQSGSQKRMQETTFWFRKQQSYLTCILSSQGSTGPNPKGMGNRTICLLCNQFGSPLSFTNINTKKKRLS